MYENLYNY